MIVLNKTRVGFSKRPSKRLYLERETRKRDMYELQKRHVDYTANPFCFSREAWLTRGNTCRHSRYLLLIMPPCGPSFANVFK